MSRITIARVTAIAALLVSTAASAASYTGHYKYPGDPSLDSYARLQNDLATCDGVYGVRHATPSKRYQSCMRQQGWKFLYETRDKEAASDGFSANVKLKPGHYIDHNNGMDCQNFGGAAVCTPPESTVHYYDRIRGCPVPGPASSRSARICKQLLPSRLNHRVAATTNAVAGPTGVKTMVALSRVPAHRIHRASYRSLLVQLGWLAGAAVFVALLCLSCGLDLSPGFF